MKNDLIELQDRSWIKANTFLSSNQEKVISCSADITAFFDSAGVGKTTASVMKCLRDGTRTIIYCGNSSQLKLINGIIRQIVGPYGSKHRDGWTVDYPYKIEDKWGSKKVTIQVLVCSSIYEAQGCQGNVGDIIVFDEIRYFSEEVFRFLIGWNRSDTGNKCQVIVTGIFPVPSVKTPPTPPKKTWFEDFWGDWLKKDAANPAEPGELRWFAFIDGKKFSVENGKPFEHCGEKINPFSMTAFFSLLEGNTTL